MTGEVTLNQFIIALLEAAYRSIKQATDDLTDEQLYYQPTAETNSIAWLVWHLSRWRDAVSATISGESQIWMSARMGQAVRDTGRTHRPGRYPSPGDGLPCRARRVVWLCRCRAPANSGARRCPHSDAIGATDHVVHWREAAGMESPGRRVRRIGATYRDRSPTCEV